MTTIAYRDGVLAADTQQSYGNLRVMGINKIVKAGGLLAGATGDAVACKNFLDWVMKGCPESCPPMVWSMDKDWRGTGYIFLDGMVIEFWPQGSLVHRPAFFAAGSGCDFAMGAMANGADARRAVEIAAEYDKNTGGIVQSLSIHEQVPA